MRLLRRNVLVVCNLSVSGFEFLQTDYIDVLLLIDQVVLEYPLHHYLTGQHYKKNFDRNCIKSY